MRAWFNLPRLRSGVWGVWFALYASLVICGVAATPALSHHSPFIEISPRVLPDGYEGEPYDAHVSANGASQISFYYGSPPPGLRYDPDLHNNAVHISGIPTAPGNYSLLFGATGYDHAIGEAQISLRIVARVRFATASVLAHATPLSAYEVTLAATGGTGALAFTAVSPPPPGLSLSSSGRLSGSPTTIGLYSFDVRATDTRGVSDTRTFALKVGAAPLAQPKTAMTLAGVPVSIDLAAGASNPPVTAAAISIPPAHGTATLDGLQVIYTPSAAFDGEDSFGYTLSNAVGVSAPATVMITVTARPDPSRDPEVTALIGAQNEAVHRFATAQIGNIGGRLEQLRADRSGASLQLGFAGGSQTLLQSDPRQFARLSELGVLRPAPGDWARNGFDARPGDERRPIVPPEGRLGLWAAGVVDFGRRDGTAAQSRTRFTTDGLTAGLDYRFTDRVVLGGALGWAQDTSKVGSNGTRSEVVAYSLAVYSGLQITETVFFDGIVGWGNLDFESRRPVKGTGDIAIGRRDGSQWFAAVTGGWKLEQGAWRISPYGRLAATSSTLDDFAETGAGPAALAYAEQSVGTATGTAGLRLGYDHLIRSGTLTPRLRLEYSHDFQGGRRAGLSYVDLTGGPIYSAEIASLERNRLSVGLGLDLILSDNFQLSVDYDTLVGSDDQSSQVRVMVQTQF